MYRALRSFMMLSVCMYSTIGCSRTLILRFSVSMCVAAERGVGQDLGFKVWLALAPKLSDLFQ